ncbi:membrane protein, PF01595 family [Bacteriovorax sp. BSW11_IV]|uniref:hemolysin family protein n=1 Tax=Bacteriovorax sp. BSW11_IV TaxID=1353529 RepID=UPI000389DD39|nr:hemolysin family protein [Bacteriovorax sp. BSW11_IV]EQC48259.1 membrane protein, PF01595 family [Bacteriovorax sp. BSW11_IV]
MEIDSLEIFSLVLCLILSAFFSGSEAVLLSLNIDRARQLIDAGGSKGRALQFMVERPSELLTTILVGNNIVNILASSLTTVIFSRIFDNNAIGISVGITTLAILVFGEIMPKTFARTHAEGLSVFVIRVLQAMYYVIYPIVKIMVWVIHTILGENAQLAGRIVTKNDIEYMVQRAEKENTIDSKQLDLLNSILEFPTIKVKDIMIPRMEIKYIQAKSTYEEVLDVVKRDTHSRYPVCDGELENMKGFLHVKDLAFVTDEDKKEFDLLTVLKAPFFVYEHMKIQAVFDHMNRKKVHLALVKDENGIIVGVITLEDIIEEIMGEIQDEHDVEEEDVRKEYEESDLEQGITVEGTTSLRELYNDYDIKIPLNDNYSTLAGFILDMLGNTFPEQGQIIVWEGLSFDLTRVDDYEIREVRIRDVDGEKHYFSRREVQEEQSSPK